MKRAIILLGGLCVIAVAGVVVWQTGLTQSAHGDGFSPSAGTTVAYRVGHRVVVREAADENGPTDRWAQTYGLMRYRAEDFGDTRQLHISPLTLVAHNQDGPVFTSQLAALYSSADLRHVQERGFDMPFDSDGALALERPRTRALAALAEQIDTPDGNPILDQLIVPTLPPALASHLAPRVGATHVLERYRGLSHIRATVERVDDDTLTIRLETTDRSRTVADNGAPETADRSRLLARLRVNRHDGWIESMTRVRRDYATRDGRAVAIDHVTRARRKRDLLTGDMHDTSDPFWGVTDESPDDVEVRQSPANTRQPDPATDDPAFDTRETALRVELSVLHLGVRVDDEHARLPLNTVALTDLTLYDREDRPVELPIELNNILPSWDYRTFEPGRLFIYAPLAGDPAIFEPVARAEATLTYRQTKSRSVTIALDDARHELTHGPARVSVEPDAAADNVWWLQIENRDGYAYKRSWAQAAPGVHAMAGVAPRDSWLSAAEAELMARVDSPSAEIETVRVQADHAPAAYPLMRITPGKTRSYTVEFKRRDTPQDERGDRP
ncbi:hypothetical protein SAOR_01965 [Salinisphaera orenii MK-B5]|uniref:Uncharacterized protein n=1 Tax=Salinisphaera orenii MK-B5 TaxID=856730 RepID=A0A423PWJ8_9GAMM|nr:hypothetical protein [Salinisphaera orenii]ROO29954.1 hypothetical protein SAOR_01965 [Salinisphaera orenii MK-B5]